LDATAVEGHEVAEQVPARIRSRERQGVSMNERDAHHWRRLHRIVEPETRGKSKLIVRKYTEPKDSVLQRARRYKAEVLKLAYVDGEKQ